MATSQPIVMARPAIDTASVSISKGFLIALIIIVGFICGIMIANAIYYARLEKEGGTGVVSTSSANFLKWANGIFAFIAGVVFIWALVRLFVSQGARQAIATNLAGPPQGVVSYNPQTGSFATNFRPGENVYCNATGQCVNELGQVVQRRTG